MNEKCVLHKSNQIKSNQSEQSAGFVENFPLIHFSRCFFSRRMEVDYILEIITCA